MKPNNFLMVITLIIGLPLLWTPLALSQSGTTAPQLIPFDSDRWQFNAGQSKVVDYLGRKSLFLQDGLAIVKDSEFTDGIIEYDVAVSGERGFMGAVWRLQDLQNYEEFYIRPHQSGNPDANQYSPVFNDLAAWQLYYVERGFGAPFKYRFNEWMHVKIVASGKNAEVYIMDMEKPLFFVDEQKREVQSGKVGLRVQLKEFAPAHFSNFSFISMNNPPLKGRAKEPGKTPAGTVMSWFVSEAFNEKSLDNKFRLTEEDKKKLTWKKLGCENTGLAHLARLQGVTPDKNCVFAKVTIVSDKDQTKPLKFGFSDRIKVFFNDQIVYGGNDTYRTRDYRFLGTIGFFDELYVSLKKGENELWMAVAETAGGWGVQARFENPEGITMKE